MINQNKEISSEFETKSESNEWKIKAEGAAGPAAFGASSAGKITDAMKQQFDEQFSDAMLTVRGGGVKYAVALATTDVPSWVSTLGNSELWVDIKREKPIPVYALLDQDRREKFNEILARGGVQRWRNNGYVPSLRLIDFDWYLSFGEPDLDELFG